MEKKYVLFVLIMLVFSNLVFVIPSEKVLAVPYDGEDLALALLANSSWLLDTSYTDTDNNGNRQSIVLSQKGTMIPTHGSTFALLSTGVAGTDIVTTDEDEPGSERGEWFQGGSHGYPRDEVILTLDLQVPAYMHYLYYDVQFFSSEYPEYVGTQYNDKLTVTVESPSKGTSSFVFDVNSGYFLLDSRDIPNTGFDIFARSSYPSGVDYVDTIYRHYGSDAGASDLIQIGGTKHPVSPNEQITVTFRIKDNGDNQFDSAAYIDNLKFTGYAKTDIMARKTVEDILGQPIETAESGDMIKYKVTISNTGTADQENNPGNEFEDIIPENTIYDSGSATATSGTINYNTGENKITWNGEIEGESSVILTFNVIINGSASNGTVISNQGTVYWDSNEDGTNDETELTDNPYVDDGLDQDGDGETDDDDSTDVLIFKFECPTQVTETFSDDSTGGKANQSYLNRQWFETTYGCPVGTNFHVAGNYHYDTSKSFKTKIRQTDCITYWNYTLSELEGDMIWWESWFACGDTCEAADLYLDFKNNDSENITRLKFEYVETDGELPMNWYLQLSFWNDQIDDWELLQTDLDGYLRNGWYKIRLEKNGSNNIKFILNRSGVGEVDMGIGREINDAFSDFVRVEFYSKKNPVLCPMFFWDEHSVGLEPS